MFHCCFYCVICLCAFTGILIKGILLILLNVVSEKGAAMFLGIHNIFISYRTTVSYKNLFLAFQKRIAHNRELLTPSRFHLSPVLRFVRNFT